MIEFQNVSFSYPDSGDGGLKHIDLTIPDGQCVLLCGRSGCGKTTLTRLINGLIPQFFAGELRGRVLLDGKDLTALPMYRIAEKVGSVFQNPRTQFFNVDTDGEIAFGLENRAAARSRKSPSPPSMPWTRRYGCWTSPPATWTWRPSTRCGSICG